MECPLLINTDKVQLVKLMIEKDKIIEELLEENQRLIKWFKKYQEKEDEEYWNI